MCNDGLVDQNTVMALHYFNLYTKASGAKLNLNRNVDVINIYSQIDLTRWPTCASQERDGFKAQHVRSRNILPTP